MKLLCTADIHLKEKKPECRIAEEDWLQVIEQKMARIGEIASDANVDAVVIAGDVFDGWRGVSFEFFNRCVVWMNYIKANTKDKKIYTIAGNHDLPEHLYEQISRTPYQAMCVSGVFTDIYADDTLPFTCMAYTDQSITASKDILVAHKGLYLENKIFPGVSENAQVGNFVKNCIPPNVRLVIAGDFHKPFTTTIGSTLVVNCGSIFRLRADQCEFQPVVHIVDTDMMTVVSKKLPLSNPIRRDYIDDRNDRKEELNEIIGSIDGDFEITLNYRDNFKKLTEALPNQSVINSIFERTLQ